MKVIGITGGIGTGKSTVCEILLDKGYPVINADKIGHEILNSNNSVIEQIINIFGDNLLNEDSSINRKALGEIVFSDESKLVLLNSIIHPIVLKKINEKINELKETKNQYIFIEAGVPEKQVFIDICDEIWVVTARKSIRIKRTQNRDNISLDNVQNRINLQNKRYNYNQIANKIIKNNRKKSYLEIQINKILLSLD